MGACDSRPKPAEASPVLECVQNSIESLGRPPRDRSSKSDDPEEPAAGVPASYVVRWSARRRRVSRRMNPQAQRYTVVHVARYRKSCHLVILHPHVTYMKHHRLITASSQVVLHVPIKSR